MRMTCFAAALLLSACSNPAPDPWTIREAAWERTPEIHSTREAERMAEDLKQKDSITLDEAYRLALHRSETLAIDAEELARIQSLYDQAVGAILPRVSLKASYIRQDTSGTSAAGSTSNVVFKDRPEYKLYARQPIFSGFKEFYALRQSDALYEGRKHELRQAALELYAGVAEAFHAVLQVQRDLDTTDHSLALARERLDELAQRNRLGISRRSELLAQEAEVSSVEARVALLKGALVVAWEALKFATGLPGRPALGDPGEVPARLPPAEELVARAVAVRSDLLARRKYADAAEEGIGVAKSGRYPVVSAEGNWYLHREGALEESDWDFTISGELPLFDGFGTNAKIREAESAARVARLDLDRLQRQVEVDITRAYADVQSFRSQIASLDAAVASAQENYEIVQAEYRQGIVANVEVLAAFNTLQVATLARDQARTQLRLAFIHLAVDSGVLPGELK